MQTAALYLRSSKDRSSVSIDAQRRELLNLAAARDLAVVAEFADVVESGKTDQRPGFQALLRALKDRERNWSILLVTDTSRLSRRRYVAQVFKHQCRRHAVDILYAKVPETDPITAVILESVFEAMDEVHSLMSREKGLAGMAENIRQGYRAGGRAPLGYRLKSLDTGSVREGAAVTKTVLEPDASAPLVARFLKARARGEPRTRLLRELGVGWKPNSLVVLEWNALTYAGHTVWNRHAAAGGGRKFRPREQWLIRRDTHPALIGDAEAETLLDRLESSTVGEAIRAAKQGLSSYLLTGLLHAPDGRMWEGWRGIRYRLKPAGDRKGRYVEREALDDAVRAQVVRDLGTSALIRDLTRAARSAAARMEADPAAGLRLNVVRLNEQVSKAMDLALALADPAPAVRKVNELEVKRAALAAEIARIEREQAGRSLLCAMTEERVAAILAGVAADLNNTPPERWKTVLHALIKRIDLDPESLDCQIRYRIAAQKAVTDTPNVASPRGKGELGIEASRELKWKP